MTSVDAKPEQPSLRAKEQLDHVLAKVIEKNPGNSSSIRPSGR